MAGQGGCRRCPGAKTDGSLSDLRCGKTRGFQTLKYQKRPAEELYDVVNDPHCLNNLVGQAGSESIRSELSRQLDDWMADQGDQGVATEDLALTRQKKGQNNKNKNQNKNKKKNQDKQTEAGQ